ncbi:MAG TPA: T9SS type A sorting domain-containing protein [Candidatus Kapabacteria bacterium]|nr:T9SS type A sorting domain-containing protein [Candidatus Kapabacteria bacterium]
MSTRYALIRAFIAALFLITYTHILYAQANTNCDGGKPIITNGGTDFLLVYMQNDDQTYDPYPDPSCYQDVYVANIENSPVTVTTTCKGNNFSEVDILPVNGSKVIRLTRPLATDFIVETEEVVSNMAVRVSATGNIVCYGMNHKSVSADAFMAIPRNVAENTSLYMTMCYHNSTNNVFNTSTDPGEFAVGAFSDNTTVKITTPVNTTQKQTSITYQLNAGQCVQIQAFLSTGDNNDLTGSIIQSDSPIVVYSGHRRTEVPHDYIFFASTGQPHSSRDHIAEAMPPYSTWGRSFVTRNFPGHNADDIMRILSGEDDNVVTINGQPFGTPFKKGEFRDDTVAQSITPAENIVTVQTSKPSLVGMLMHTATDDTAGLGDPFLAIVPPMAQTYNDFPYFISTDSIYPTNDLIVVADSSCLGKIDTDGVPLGKGLFTKAKYQTTNKTGQLRTYYVAVVPQTPGAHHITAPGVNADSGFTILSYGIGRFDSYGYTAGSLFVPTVGIWREPDPIGIPAPGKPEQPSFTIRNILGNESVWLDSIRISYISNPEQIPVVTKNIPMTYFGILPAAAKQHIILAPATTPSQEITGIATIYYHTGVWFDLEPLNVNFTVAPGTSASVANAPEFQISAAAYPNPVTSDMTTIEFLLPKASHTNVKLFDALGRMIMTVADEAMMGGKQDISINTHSLVNGTYFFEISSAESGLSQRGTLIVAH